MSRLFSNPLQLEGDRIPIWLAGGYQVEMPSLVPYLLKYLHHDPPSSSSTFWLYPVQRSSFHGQTAVSHMDGTLRGSELLRADAALAALVKDP